MEANAEHDFRLKRLIGMLRTIAKQVLRHKFFVPSAKRHCREDLLTPESYMAKKCLRHFMKNLRFFFNLFPSGEGISYKAIKDAWQNQTSFFSSLILFPLHLFHNRNYLRYHIVHIFKHSAFCRSHLARPFDMFQYLPVSFFHLVEAKA